MPGSVVPLAMFISFKYAFSDLLQIGSKFGLLMHDITSKVPKLATRLSHIATLPWNAFLSLSVRIQFVSSSAGVTSVKFHKRLSLTHSLRETRHIDRTRRPGSDNESDGSFFHFPYIPFKKMNPKKDYSPLKKM